MDEPWHLYACGAELSSLFWWYRQSQSRYKAGLKSKPAFKAPGVKSPLGLETRVLYIPLPFLSL